MAYYDLVCMLQMLRAVPEITALLFLLLQTKVLMSTDLSSRDMIIL
jgi:hypothetical protein